jgi:hypothetical protein
VAALQRYFDGGECLSVEEVFSAARQLVDDISRSRCGVPPECLLLPVALRLLLREDLDESVRRTLETWVNSLGPILCGA